MRWLLAVILLMTLADTHNRFLGWQTNSRKPVWIKATGLVTTHDGDFAAWQPGDAVLMPLLMQYVGVPGRNRKPGR